MKFNIVIPISHEKKSYFIKYMFGTIYIKSDNGKRKIEDREVLGMTDLISIIYSAVLPEYPDYIHKIIQEKFKIDEDDGNLSYAARYSISSKIVLNIRKQIFNNLRFYYKVNQSFRERYKQKTTNFWVSRILYLKETEVDGVKSQKKKDIALMLFEKGFIKENLIDLLVEDIPLKLWGHVINNIRIRSIEDFITRYNRTPEEVKAIVRNYNRRNSPLRNLFELERKIKMDHIKEKMKSYYI